MPKIILGPSTPKSKKAPVELYFEDHGSEKPVVLIHGWPLSGADVGKADAGVD